MPRAADQQALALARLLELSDLMLCNAITGLWDSVIELQSLRDGLIREFFSQPLSMDSGVLASGIQHILECDEQLADAVREERKSLQKQIIADKQSKDVTRAYSNF